MPAVLRRRAMLAFALMSFATAAPAATAHADWPGLAPMGNALFGAYAPSASAATDAPDPDWAAHTPVGSPRLNAALALAVSHWGATPCGGQEQISWVAQAPQINAASTWSNPTDLYANASQNTDCAIALNPAAQWDWPKFCTVVVHEVGHLDGQQHSADPTNVMTPVYNQPVAECAAAPDPQAPAVQSAPVAAPAAAPAAAITATRGAAASTGRAVATKVAKRVIAKPVAHHLRIRSHAHRHHVVRHRAARARRHTVR